MEREAGGVVALVVRASRVLGVASLRGRGAGRGTAERVHVVYSIALISTLNITVYIGIIIKAMQNVEALDPGALRNVYLSSIGWILSMANTLLFVIVGAYSGRGRVKRLLEHSERVEKIKIQTDTTKQANPWWKKKRIVLSSLVWALSFNQNILYCIFEMKTNDLDFAPVYSFVAFLGLFSIEMIIQLQVLLLLYSISAAMGWITEELSQIYDNIPETRLLNKKEEARLRHVGRMYGYIGDVVNRVNKEDGWLLLLMFVSNFLSIVYGMYWQIAMILGESSKSSTSDKAMLVCWNMINIMLIVAIVEPCHQFQKEVEKARVVLSRLMYRTQAPGEPSSLVVDVLCKQLLQDAPAFAPLGVCTITRSLCTTMLSAAVTVLVFIVQNQEGAAENN